MKLTEAKELYDKLKPLENKCKMEGDFIIHKFFILPIKYIKENNITINWDVLMESEDILKMELLDNRNLEFNIVAIHQANSFTFLPSYDIEHFKNLAT